MRHTAILAALSVAAVTSGACAEKVEGYPITPVPFTQVRVAPNSFWGQRFEALRVVTIPLALEKCATEGRYANFARAAAPSAGYDVGELMPYPFDDTDPYKAIEGASYILQTCLDGRLEAYIDSVLDIIGKAQEPDGYLYTARTQNPWHPHPWAGAVRWSEEESLSHELYNLGHMIEAAVAHHQATGSHKFLDMAMRFADCVVREIGSGEGQAHVAPGHQIAEMALCGLYLATGGRKYLDEARYLLDCRGRTAKRSAYSQSHVPVAEQTEAVGHAVRAAYMYAGMADVAALTGNRRYVDAVGRIWQDIVDGKLYITGGIGATANGEAFGEAYELPNMSAYCETCAAVGNVYVNHRLFLLHGESKYCDVLERALYNGLISGVSLDGGAFFYPNPLESAGQHARQAWFGCACCPGSICRFLPSVPGYVYAVRGRSVYVNLFMPNDATLSVGGKEVALSQKTDYPWDGDIAVTIDRNGAGAFALKIRMPGWVMGQVVPSDLYYYADDGRPGYTVTVNGGLAGGRLTGDGYYTIDRKWRRGDVVQLHLDMEARMVRASDKVEADRGQVAVERGPLVYCAEWPDNDFDITAVRIARKPLFRTGTMPYGALMADSLKPRLTIFQGQRIVTLAVHAMAPAGYGGGQAMRGVTLRLVPYFAWAHRGAGLMRVWMPQDALP